MLKNIIRFEQKVGEKIYHFVCDPDSPIEHVKEALFAFTKHVGQIEDDIKAKQEQANIPSPEVPSEKVEEIPKE